ncbi:hypothetical protein Golob_004461, partial [Gossypium lobatum]|nr:hypothetical protein [Gossypium lobatum]
GRGIGQFIWLVFKQRLLTNSERVRRGIGQEESCHLCGYNTEDALHVLKDCPFANDIWNQVIPSNQHKWFFNGNLSEWLLCNLRDQSDNSMRGLVSYNWEKQFSSVYKEDLVMELQQTPIQPYSERWCLRYVPRENNKIADALAKMALSNVEGLHMIEDPSIEIQEVIREDKARGNL